MCNYNNNKLTNVDQVELYFVNTQGILLVIQDPDACVHDERMDDASTYDPWS